MAPLATKENPYNDTTVQLPAVGSGQGVKELYTAGSTARSLRTGVEQRAGGNPCDQSTQNIISYAMDGDSVGPTSSVVVRVSGPPGGGADDLDHQYQPDPAAAGLRLIRFVLPQTAVQGSTYKMDWYCLGP